MTHALVLLLSLLGLGALTLAMERHQQDVLGRTLATRSNCRLRLTGWTAVTVALATAVLGLGWGFGLVAWFGHLSVAAGLVFSRLAACPSKN